MNTTDVAQSNLPVPATPLAAARAPRSVAQPKKRGNPVLFIVCMVIVFLAGIAAGVLIVRQRNKARDIVVAINGVTIDKTDFYRRLEANAGVPVIRSLVAEELEYQYAQKLKVAPSAAEVDRKYAEASKQPNFEAALAQQHQTPEDFRRGIRSNLSKIAVLTKGITATEADARHFYAVNTDKKNPTARFYTPDTANVAVIVTSTEAEGQKALAALQAGQPFEKVAAQYSKDVSKANGGHLTPILRGRNNSSKVPGLEDAIFGLGIGQQIGPRKFAGAWWIIHCIDKKVAETQPYEKVAQECLVGAKLSKVPPTTVKEVEAGYSKFQTDANVQAFWERYKQAVNLKQ